MRSPGLATLLGVVFAATHLAGCGSAKDDFETEIYSIRGKTTPADGQLKDFTPILRKGSSVTASWQIETALEWRVYVDFVTDKLRPEYSVTRSTETELLMHRSLPGDAYRVHITMVINEKVRGVHLEFSAVPN